MYGELTDKIVNWVKINGRVTLEDIQEQFEQNKEDSRSLISRPIADGILKEKFLKTNGTSRISYVKRYVPVSKRKKETVEKVNDVEDSVTINPLEIKKPFVADTSKMLEVPNKSKYFHVTGIGTLSPELLSQLFSEGILVMDVEKLIKKMNVDTLKIHNDKISFDLAEIK